MPIYALIKPNPIFIQSLFASNSSSDVLPFMSFPSQRFSSSSENNQKQLQREERQTETRNMLQYISLQFHQVFFFNSALIFHHIIGGSQRYLIGLKPVLCPKIWEFTASEMKQIILYKVSIKPTRGEIFCTRATHVKLFTP